MMKTNKTTDFIQLKTCRVLFKRVMDYYNKTYGSLDRLVNGTIQA